MTLASSASPVTAISRLTALRVPPTVALSFAIIALVIAWSLVPGLFTSQNPVNGVPADKLLGPNAGHWFGTDHLGRDLYTRVVYGTASSVTSDGAGGRVGGRHEGDIDHRRLGAVPGRSSKKQIGGHHRDMQGRNDKRGEGPQRSILVVVLAEQVDRRHAHGPLRISSATSATFT